MKGTKEGRNTIDSSVGYRLFLKGGTQAYN